MEGQAPARVKPPRRWLIAVGLVSLQLLLMGAAYVGGRLLASQNPQSNSSSPIGQLPSQLPKEQMAGSGTVQKIQNNTITLSQRGGFGSMGGGPPSGGGAPSGGGPSSSGGGPSGGPSGGGSTIGGASSNLSSQLEVAVSAETKYYKNTSSGGEMPGMPGASGGSSSIQIQYANLSDIKVGNTIMVWGTKNGQRITAEVIYIE